MTTPIVVCLLVGAVCNGFIINMVQGRDETTAIDIEASLVKRVSLPFKTLYLFTVLTSFDETILKWNSKRIQEHMKCICTQQTDYLKFLSILAC